MDVADIAIKRFAMVSEASGTNWSIPMAILVIAFCNFSVAFSGGLSATLSVTIDSNSRLSIKLTAAKANTLETHNEWSVTNAASNTKVTDVLSIEAGFARDAGGNVLGHAANDTLRFNTINLGTHQGGEGSGDWNGVNAGRLINPVLVNDNQLFYAWDRNANGSHGPGATFSGDLGLAAFMGKGASSNVTEDLASRSFTLNGVDLRLPTAGETPLTKGNRPGTAIGNANNRLLGDTTENPTYNDLLAIWDAFNGTGTGTDFQGWPSGWAGGARYWSATPSGSGHAWVHLFWGNVGDLDGDNGNNFVAFEVL